jgi:small-conductance mechanosensitive channel
VGGLAIALATKGLLEDLFSGFVLQARHPFHRGDEIAVGKHEGVVEDINLRAVVLASHDGERLIVPSSMVLKETIENLTTYGARRTILPVHVPFGVDIDTVATALTDAVQACELVHDEPPVTTLVKAIGESGVELAVIFWHDPGRAEKLHATDAAANAAIGALARLGVDHEVPLRRVLGVPPS